MKKPDETMCHYCHWIIRGKEITIDHKVPRKKGGTNFSGNLVFSCVFCNLLKGSMDYDVFVALLKKYPINSEIRRSLMGSMPWSKFMRKAQSEWAKIVYKEEAALRRRTSISFPSASASSF